MLIGDYIRTLREQKGFTQADLAKLAGLSAGYISLLESNDRTRLAPHTINKLARALRIKPQILYDVALGKDKDIELQPRSPTELLRELNALMCAHVPIRGSIPAGTPMVKEEAVEGYIAIAKDELGTTKKNTYALRVCGDSLEGDNIHDGDFLVIEPTTDVLDGKIYILRLENEVVTRHVLRQADKLKLVASNGDYQIIEVDQAEILGRVILAGAWQKF